MLQIKDLHAYYGQIEALKGINLEVKDGDISCLIGSNGAGKTTTLKAISGMINRIGSILWIGQETITQSPIKIAKNAIMHVPEGRHVFTSLTVEQNLETGTCNWVGFAGGKNYKEDLENI